MERDSTGLSQAGTDEVGGALTKIQKHLRFKNVDAIGHPGIAIFNSLASGFGYSCKGGATPLMPYFVSTLDFREWRSGLIESLYPEALIPGKRELKRTGDLWGNVYPRSGFINQVHDYKAAALMAQRSSDIVTRKGQPHVYKPMLASSKLGYWPPVSVKEGHPDHRWQHIAPKMDKSCVIWPDRSAIDPYADRLDEEGDYVFSLWQRYRCCKKRGQKLLLHTGH